MKNILIISGHPALRDNSFANKIIMEDLEKLLPEATFDCLSDLYPDYRIDVEAEQKKLVAADIIVLQFPIFWYSMPALLAKWMEEVFVHGFSHGTTGKALVQKNSSSPSPQVHPRAHTMRPSPWRRWRNALSAQRGSQAWTTSVSSTPARYRTVCVRTQKSVQRWLRHPTPMHSVLLKRSNHSPEYATSSRTAVTNGSPFSYLPLFFIQ